MVDILVLPGDGIGIEVIGETLKILKVLDEKHSLNLHFSEALFGGASIDEHGVPVMDEVIEKAKGADAVLLGAVGGPKWDDIEYSIRPERALLRIRKDLGLFANLRPATVYSPLAEASSLKREVVEGVDLLVVRELTGGIYFGEPKGIDKLDDGQEKGYNTLVYTTSEIKRIARVAFEAAMKRNKKVTSVDKANILESSELWRRTVIEMHQNEFPEVELDHMYVDNATMQLIRCPKQFDVILAGNMFGDILSDAAAMLTGSIGMLPSASLGERGGLFEPVHGSAPDIAGKGIANPLATIMSAAMMLKYTLKMPVPADELEIAVMRVLKKGFRTKDIMQTGSSLKEVTTTQMGDAVLEEL